MVYNERLDWKDDEAGGTPIMAADLIRIETGVNQAHDQLDGRLGVFGKAVTDWNTATENGWYRATDTALNGPPANYYMGQVVVYDANWITQTVFTLDGGRWRRDRDAASWGKWQVDDDGPDLISGLQFPIFIAHRGGPLAFPEHSMEGYRASAEAGFAVEQDVQVLSDGTLVCIHDATTDRTMIGTGNVSAKTRAQWLADFVVPTFPGMDHATPVLWQQVADELGGNALLMPEVKVAGALTPLLNDIVRRKLQRAVIVQSFTYSDCTAAVARGIEACFLSNTATPATLIADGIKYLGCSTAASNTYITDAKNAGLKVFVYTATTKAISDAQFNRGADGVFSDDPWYHSQRRRKSSDTFGVRGEPYSGLVSLVGASDKTSAKNFSRRTRRGFNVKVGASEVGTSTLSWRADEFGPFPMTGSTVRFGVTWEPRATSQTRWVGLAIGELPIDAAYNDTGATAGQNIYHILPSRDGNHPIWKNTAAGGAVSLTAASVITGTQKEVAPLGLGGSALYEIRFTATQIIVVNLTTGFTRTLDDTSLRPTQSRIALNWRNCDATFDFVEVIPG